MASSRRHRTTRIGKQPWRVVFLDASTFDREDVSFDGFTCKWDCTFHQTSTYEETSARLEGFQVAVTNKAKLDAALLARPEAQELKLIAVAATGVNVVDLGAAKDRGIKVCNVAGYGSAAVAQHTIALLLELATHAGRYAQEVPDAWPKSPHFTLLTHPCTELDGKTLGLIGSGAIGGRVARIAEALGMKVIVAARAGAPAKDGRVPLNELLERADVISLHCPLTPETQNLIDARALARMKPRAFIINTARGGIVNEAALIQALKEKRIGGAAFDVLTQEPPPPDHPMLAAARALDNLIVTPHCAWSPIETRQRLLDEVYENIVAYERGEERNRVA